MITAEALATHNAAMLEQLEEPLRTEVAGFLLRFPDTRITSAGRDYREQARDMAANVCAERARTKRLTWIAETYYPTIKAVGSLEAWSRAAALGLRELQAWVLEHPETSEPDCVAAFCEILEALPPLELSRVSKHLLVPGRSKSRAVDFQPEEGTRGDMKAAVLLEIAHRLGGRLLTREGALIVWHLQL